MSQIIESAVFDSGSYRVDEVVDKDLIECQKHLKLLQNYRQVLSEFALKCVCRQIKKVFNSLEVVYNQIIIKTNESQNQTNYETICKNSDDIHIEVKTSSDDLNSTTIERPIVSQINQTIDVIDDNSKNNRNKTKTSFKKYIELFDELKSGKLKTFIDPNNKLISVIRRKNDSNDGSNEWRVVFKCNYNYCEFETNKRVYIRKHVERHSERVTTRCSPIKYRIFCHLLEDLKKRKIDSFLDPEYNLISVHLKENQLCDDYNEQSVVYKCNYSECPYESFSKYYIRNHVLRHKKDKTFVCKLCKNEFSSKLNLIEHRIHIHNIDKHHLFTCDWPHCPYKTTVKQSMDNHSVTHQTEKTVKCDFDGCDGLFKSVVAMKVHQKSVHINRMFTCEWPGCEARSKSQKYMRSHLLSHSGHNITVGKIRNILKNGNYVSTVDTNNDIFSVIREQTINENTGKIEVGPKLGYKCNNDQCHFVCISLNVMTQHITTHSIGKQFECEFCLKMFGLKKHLNYHKKMVHNINNRSPVLRCQTCDYETKNVFCFKQHSLTHQTETPFKCKQNGCEKSFKTELSLKSHIVYSHTKVRPFICERTDCNSAFKMRSELKRHMKCHSEERLIYGCDRCTKTFKFKSILTKHQKTKH